MAVLLLDAQHDRQPDIGVAPVELAVPHWAERFVGGLLGRAQLGVG